VVVEPPFIAELPVARAALEWAESLHHGQLRAVDLAPFILHPTEVAAALSLRGYDDEVVAAGLLHDAIEGSEADITEVRRRFGDRVARIVAAVSEDPDIADRDARKAALRAQVAAADGDAHAVFAADKVVKTRELRAQAALVEGTLDEPDLHRRLEHYEASLAMLATVAPGVPIVQQLAFELWALRALPPSHVASASRAS
jgi:hypothetical protein